MDPATVSSARDPERSEALDAKHRGTRRNNQSGGNPMSEGSKKPALLVQTVYFHNADQASAETLGFELYDLLTRPRGERERAGAEATAQERLAFGPAIPVRIAVEPEEVGTTEARHIVIIPVLGP